MTEQLAESSIITLPRFVVACSGDKVIIMRTAGPAAGEGGMFDMQEFDEAVNKFFEERF